VLGPICSETLAQFELDIAREFTVRPFAAWRRAMNLECLPPETGMLGDEFVSGETLEPSPIL
jgi:hypothetical protein